MLNWLTLPFAPSRNSLPFNATTSSMDNSIHNFNVNQEFDESHTHSSLYITSLNFNFRVFWFGAPNSHSLRHVPNIQKSFLGTFANTNQSLICSSGLMLALLSVSDHQPTHPINIHLQKQSASSISYNLS